MVVMVVLVVVLVIALVVLLVAVLVVVGRVEIGNLLNSWTAKTPPS